MNRETATTVTVAERVDALQQTFNAGTTRPMAWRLDQLAAMRRFLKSEQDAFLDALRDDLGAPFMEALRSNLMAALSEISLAERRLPEWVQPIRVETPPAQQPEESWRYPEPYGTVLVLSPWNIPVGLCLLPAACSPPPAPWPPEIPSPSSRRKWPQPHLKSWSAGCPSISTRRPSPASLVGSTSPPNSSSNRSE
jgi:hypothetical protein